MSLLQNPSSFIGQVIKAIDKKKVLVKIPLEGKFVVTIDRKVDINDVKPNCRVAINCDSFTLHRVLPQKVC